MTLQDRLRHKASIADADGDEYGCVQVMREAAAELDRLEKTEARYQALRSVPGIKSFPEGTRVNFTRGGYEDTGVILDSTVYLGRVLVKWDREFDMQSMCNVDCLSAIDAAIAAKDRVTCAS